MKILYYSSHPHLKLSAPAGYGRHMREMIAAWRAQGHDVLPVIAGDLISGDSGEIQVKYGSNSRGIKNFIPPLIWETLKDLALMRFDKRMKAELQNAVQSFQPDCIYERITYLQTSGLEVAGAKGIRHVSEINAPYPEERVSFSGKSLLLSKARKSELKILQNSDGISVVSSALKKHFSEILPEASSKILVVPNAVSPIGKLEVDAQVIKNRYNVSEGLIIGFVGSIFHYHGVDILIRAFAELAKTHSDVQLLIVGDGMILPEMEALVELLNISEKVVFTGAVPHDAVNSLISIMDICCMAKSNWYGSPVKIFEYGIHGKAILAPDVIPVRDVMSDHDAKLVVPSESEVYLGLKQLVEDENYRAQIAANWQSKVSMKYTWNQAAVRTLDLCK